MLFHAATKGYVFIHGTAYAACAVTAEGQHRVAKRHEHKGVLTDTAPKNYSKISIGHVWQKVNYAILALWIPLEIKSYWLIFADLQASRISNGMEHIGKHMAGLVPKSKRTRDTERGEMMKYFMERLNVTRTRDGLPLLTMPRMGRLLQAIPTKDLYYLKSVCEQAKDFSKKFWWEINPKKHAQK